MCPVVQIRNSILKEMYLTSWKQTIQHDGSQWGSTDSKAKKFVKFNIRVALHDQFNFLFWVADIF